MEMLHQVHCSSMNIYINLKCSQWMLHFQLIYSVNNIFSNLSLEKAKLVKRENTDEDDDRR